MSIFDPIYIKANLFFESIILKQLLKKYYDFFAIPIHYYIFLN